MRDLKRIAAFWDLLVKLAPAGTYISYSEAALQIGGIARGLGPLLQPIQHYCRDHGIPNICVLVVKSGTKKQGSGFVGDPEVEFKRVRAHDWSNTINPFQAVGRS